MKKSGGGGVRKKDVGRGGRESDGEGGDKGRGEKGEGGMERGERERRIGRR